MEPQKVDRREFFRVPFANTLRYKSYDDRGNAAKAQNISQSGILFQTQQEPPKLSSIVWLSLDLRTLKICQEIEAKALIFNNGILGKVVRVEEDAESGTSYDIGVCFLRRDQRDTEGVEQLMKTL